MRTKSHITVRPKLGLTIFEIAETFGAPESALDVATANPGRFDSLGRIVSFDGHVQVPAHFPHPRFLGATQVSDPDAWNRFSAVWDRPDLSPRPDWVGSLPTAQADSIKAAAIDYAVEGFRGDFGYGVDANDPTSTGLSDADAAAYLFQGAINAGAVGVQVSTLLADFPWRTAALAAFSLNPDFAAWWNANAASFDWDSVAAGLSDVPEGAASQSLALVPAGKMIGKAPWKTWSAGADLPAAPGQTYASLLASLLFVSASALRKFPWGKVPLYQGQIDWSSVTTPAALVVKVKQALPASACPTCGPLGPLPPTTVALCPSGFVNADPADPKSPCVPVKAPPIGPCPAGQIRNANGQCVPATVVPGPIKCPQGYTYSSEAQECVPNLPKTCPPKTRLAADGVTCLPVLGPTPTPLPLPPSAGCPAGQHKANPADPKSPCVPITVGTGAKPAAQSGSGAAVVVVGVILAAVAAAIMAARQAPSQA